MLTMNPLIPVRCLVPFDVPQADTLHANAVVTWPDGGRQRCEVVYHDALLNETRVRFWVRVGSRAEVMEQFVPSAQVERRS